MNNQPKVSIICITYNQEKFIRQALESFVMQKTKFDFEAIIGDDCSTDETREIIKEFEKKYPKIIKPIYRKKNLGAANNLINLLSGVKNEYVSICEGDDFFLDPFKLQKQVDFLEKNPHYSMCFHSVKAIYENHSRSDEILPTIEQRFEKQIFEIKDLLMRNFIYTSSVMYRWRFTDEKFENFFPKNILPCDWFLHLLHAQKGKIGFSNDVMAIYRRHNNSLWWDAYLNPDKLNLRYGLQTLNFYQNVYKMFTNNSEQYFDTTIIPFARYLMGLFLVNKKFSKLEEFSKIYKNYYNLISKEIQKKDEEIEKLNKSIQTEKYKIKLMESSKFWKLRNNYLKLKNIWNSREKE